MPRVRISNNSINSYGTRVLTQGMDISQYQRNPVLLYMHQRGQVIGMMKDVKVEGEDVTGELVFDEASDLSVQCKKQWDFGSLKMVSVGIDVLVLSEDPADLAPGQTRPTITKCKLYEVSLVDVGANDDAIILKRNGKIIELGEGGECLLPKLNNNKKEKEMDLKTLALSLGLTEKATEEEVNAKLTTMKEQAEKADALQTEKETLNLSLITAAVDKAISEKRITQDKKDQFVTLGKQVGVEMLTKTFDAMSPQVKISTILSHQGTSPNKTATEYKKLSEVPGEELEEMRKNDLKTYKKLYKAEYGIECVMDKK